AEGAARARAAAPLGDELPGLRHRVHPVCDDVRQADRAGDPLVPVDDVEVARGAAVLDQVEPGNAVRARLECGARLNVGVADGHQPAPRSTRVDLAVQT